MVYCIWWTKLTTKFGLSYLFKFIFDFPTKYIRMPHIKNALIRYRIIDKAIRNKQKPYPTKEELRGLCEEALYGDASGEHICDSTIEKDLFAMKMEHDAPVKYSRKHFGYYYTDADFSLSETPLTEEDINAIKFAAGTLAQFKESPLFSQFEFALNKIIDRINAQDNESHSERFVQFETGIKFGGNEFLEPLLEACKVGVICYFDYESFKGGAKKRRKVLPLMLKEYRNRWYLISHDIVKSATITYALERMTELEVSSTTTEEKPTFNPDHFFNYAIGITTNQDAPQQVLFSTSKVAAKYIDSQPFHKSQKRIEENHDSVKFSLHVFITEELIREFLSYGASLVVEQPNSLRIEIAKRLKAAIAKYT
jgi:predicted DNA-binding transcriptional regulator YafY